MRSLSENTEPGVKCNSVTGKIPTSHIVIQMGVTKGKKENTILILQQKQKQNLIKYLP